MELLNANADINAQDREGLTGNKRSPPSMSN